MSNEITSPKSSHHGHKKHGHHHHQQSDHAPAVSGAVLDKELHGEETEVVNPTLQAQGQGVEAVAPGGEDAAHVRVEIQGNAAALT